jgi:rhodanese-related sulfurtransferase
VGDSRLPKDKNGEILLYCRTGRMSEEAGTALHNVGYTNIAHLEGGMRGWEGAGRQLIHDPAHGSETPAEMPKHS